MGGDAAGEENTISPAPQGLWGLGLCFFFLLCLLFFFRYNGQKMIKKTKQNKTGGLQEENKSHMRGCERDRSLKCLVFSAYFNASEGFEITNSRFKI